MSRHVEIVSTRNNFWQSFTEAGYYKAIHPASFSVSVFGQRPARTPLRKLKSSLHVCCSECFAWMRALCWRGSGGLGLRPGGAVTCAVSIGAVHFVPWTLRSQVLPCVRSLSLLGFSLGQRCESCESWHRERERERDPPHSRTNVMAL